MQRSLGRDASQQWLVRSGEQDPATVARLLALLPTWFGIPAANLRYIRDADELPTYLARPADQPRAKPVGVLLARRHFPEAAEIHLLAVQPDLHRRGVGRALVQSLETDLIASRCQLLQVKTRGPSRPDAGYELTRRFYTALGFLPLEEIPELWDAENPCLIMVKRLNPASC
jgi:ribosomal protein S18 acetylase RimI-like enzyme